MFYGYTGSTVTLARPFYQTHHPHSTFSAPKSQQYSRPPHTRRYYQTTYPINLLSQHTSDNTQTRHSQAHDSKPPDTQGERSYASSARSQRHTFPSYVPWRGQCYLDLSLLRIEWRTEIRVVNEPLGKGVIGLGWKRIQARRLRWMRCSCPRSLARHHGLFRASGPRCLSHG